MGTNYYWIENKCSSCGHAKGKWHIGKSSGGWAFTFQSLSKWDSPTGYPISSTACWRDVFKRDGSIEDEYGESKSLVDFWAMVEAKKKGRQHAEEAKKGPYSDDSCYVDSEGNSFVEASFS